MEDELSIEYRTLNGTRNLSWRSERVKTKEHVLLEIEQFLRLVFQEEFIIRPKLNISTPKKLLMENAIRMTEETLSNDQLVEQIRTKFYAGRHEAEQFEFSFLKDVKNGDAFAYLDSVHPAVLG